MDRIIKQHISKVVVLAAFLMLWCTNICAQDRDESILLRANILRWATLTPDVGIEWQLNKEWSFLANATYTRWSWNDNNHRFAQKEFAGEIRHYMGYMSTQRPWYAGIMVHGGQYNFGLTERGRQGDYMGGGITAGYRLRLHNKKFFIDFGGGLGFTHATIEKYKTIDGVRYKIGDSNSNYIGINKLSVAIVWNFLNRTK